MSNSIVQNDRDKWPQRLTGFPQLTSHGVLPDGNGGFTPCPELMTEVELIQFLRIIVIYWMMDIWTNVIGFTIFQENLYNLDNPPKADAGSCSVCKELFIHRHFILPYSSWNLSSFELSYWFCHFLLPQEPYLCEALFTLIGRGPGLWLNCERAKI